MPPAWSILATFFIQKMRLVFIKNPWTMHSMNISYTYCSASDLSASKIQLLPAGFFTAIDGRPRDVKAWKIDEKLANALIKKFNQRKNPLVIDYEHQTLLAKENGQAAPASGWIKALEWVEGSGLFAVVEWTEKAKAMIASKEYQFISPVFRYNQKGEVVELLNAGLTNNPALDGMAAVAASFIYEERMEQIALSLGLQATASAEEILSAINAMQAEAAKYKEMQAAAVPAELVAQLKNEIQMLKAEKAKQETESLISAALADGRLLPAMKPWAEKLASVNVASLKEFLDVQEPIAALTKSQTEGKGAEKTAVKLSESEMQIAANLGLTAEEFIKEKN